MRFNSFYREKIEPILNFIIETFIVFIILSLIVFPIYWGSLHFSEHPIWGILELLFAISILIITLKRISNDWEEY